MWGLNGLYASGKYCAHGGWAVGAAVGESEVGSVAARANTKAEAQRREEVLVGGGGSGQERAAYPAWTEARQRSSSRRLRGPQLRSTWSSSADHKSSYSRVAGRSCSASQPEKKINKKASRGIM